MQQNESAQLHTSSSIMQRSPFVRVLRLLTGPPSNSTQATSSMASACSQMQRGAPVLVLRIRVVGPGPQHQNSHLSLVFAGSDVKLEGKLWSVPPFPPLTSAAPASRRILRSSTLPFSAATCTAAGGLV